MHARLKSCSHVGKLRGPGPTPKGHKPFRTMAASNAGAHSSAPSEAVLQLYPLARSQFEYFSHSPGYPAFMENAGGSQVWRGASALLCGPAGAIL